MTTVYAGTGCSTASDAATAAAEATASALAALKGAPPTLALAYVSVAYDVPTVVQAIRAQLPGVPLAGATSSGQFHDGQLIGPGSGVTVVLIGGDRYRFGVASATGLGADPAGAGRTLARTAKDAAAAGDAPHAAMIVLADGLSGDLQQLLSGMYRVTGVTVPVVGGAAGDDRRLRSTRVFHDDDVLPDAAVAVWVASDRPLKVVSGHGWEPISLPMLVSHTDGTLVDRIDGRPAVEVYREHIESDAQAHASDLRPGGWHSVHALGLLEPDGSQLIRAAFIDGDDTLHTFLPLPPYAAVQVVSCGPDAVLEVVESVVESAVEGQDASVLLGFSCVARLDLLGDRAVEEAKRLQAAAGAVHTAGFYTYGEFARTVGVSGVHNATLTAIAL